MTIDMTMGTREIKASEFKAKCLELMDRVAEEGEPLVITKKGKPVAQLCPLPSRPGTLAGAITIHGDIVSPLDGDWEQAG
jgi:prevent-host-death family protein